MHRYGTIDEQVAPILFFASGESSYITGSVLAGGRRRPRLNERCSDSHSHSPHEQETFDAAGR